MHQFGWLSDRGGKFVTFGTQKGRGGVPQKKRGFNPG